MCNKCARVTCEIRNKNIVDCRAIISWVNTKNYGKVERIDVRDK